MDETYFWGALEFRICRELSRSRLPSHRGAWCDGLAPESYEIEQDTPRIVGRAWIGFSARETLEWEFTLVLHWRTESRASVDWQAHLPPEDVTGWLALDRRQKHVLIDPFAAMPDPE